MSSWSSVFQSVPFAARLVLDLFLLAPFTFTIYTLGCIWAMSSAVLSLYMSSVAFDLISISTPCLNDLDAISSGHLVTLVYTCIASTLTSTLVGRMKKEASMNLRGELRSYFLPRFARARLTTRNADNVSFPGPWQFEEVAPGWDIIESLCYGLARMCLLAVQSILLVLLYWKKKTLELKLLILFSAYYPIALHAMPPNGIGGVEYTFWTKNPYYQRLASLYSLIFSSKYDEDIRKDGISSFLAAEYTRSSEQLECHRPDAMFLASNDIPRSLLWDMIYAIITDVPVLAYVLTLPWAAPSNAITKSLLLRLMTELIRNNIDICMQPKWSLCDICIQAERFYVPLADAESNPAYESIRPDVTAGNEGMKVSFRNVSVTLESLGRSKSMLHQISFTAQAGQIVALVGPNTGGKSTLLKLLPRLMEPSSGEILVDDQPITAFDVSTLRRRMTMLSQSSQELYPVSLKENITFGMPDGVQFDADVVDQAVKLGGAYDIILRVGYDAIPCAVPVLGQSMGVSPRAAVNARNIAMSVRRPVQLTREEVQRVLASRAFFRLLCGEIRLVLVDNALSELDPLAEMSIMNNMAALGKGRTIIYVAHRMSQLVTQADLILYMKEGSIVRQGTHHELMQAEAGYAAMFPVSA